MSVLLIGIAGARGAALVRRLLSEADEVRVVEDDPAAARAWSELGAHVARGSPTDADLVERAAQDVRTVAVLDVGHEVLEAVIQGSRAAARDIRLIVCSPARDEVVRRALAASGLEYFLLLTGRRARRIPSRSAAAVPVAALVEAINAADDLAGEPRLELDLAHASAWAILGLEPPGRAVTRETGRRGR